MLQEQVEIGCIGFGIRADKLGIDRVKRRNRSIRRTGVGNAAFALRIVAGLTIGGKYLLAGVGITGKVDGRAGSTRPTRPASPADRLDSAVPEDQCVWSAFIPATASITMKYQLVLQFPCD